MDSERRIRNIALVCNSRDRERLDLILGAALSVLNRPIIEQGIWDVRETKERLEKQVSLSGYSELRRLIREDTGLTVMSISRMEEAEEVGDDLSYDVGDDAEHRP